MDDALQERDRQIAEKDDELERLKSTLDWLQNEVKRLTQVNEGLTATTATLAATHEQRFSALQAEHDKKHQQLDSTSRELDLIRSQHGELQGRMEGVVREQIVDALQEKDAELDRLHRELEDAKAEIRRLQEQILASKPSDNFLVVRDEDYFDAACQQLCAHVQTWVVTFSKVSDLQGARLADEVRDEKIVDRLENAVLDGSDVDEYLRDRKKRRDVFMSVVMTMIWEFIFTRYLFGMDREQRSKLKGLEKNISEVGKS